MSDTSGHEKIRKRVWQGKYLIRSHDLAHALKEGFSRKHMLGALQYGAIIEDYPDDQRCLICGRVELEDKTEVYLHIVCEYAEIVSNGQSTVESAPEKLANMHEEHAPICGEHHTVMEWRAATFEYKEEGITVRVPNLYAWVCPADREPSFTASTVDELLLTIRDLLDAAKRARGRNAEATEYVVSLR